MAIARYIHPKSMTSEQYDEVRKRLEAQGIGTPKGRTYHACFGQSPNLMVFDVWDSPEELDAYWQRVLPILSAIGIDSGEPQIMPLQNAIVG